MAEAKKIGVVGATFLVAGNMMGSGVFLLPSSLAKIGTASIWGWLITTAGALLLAFVFAKLGKLAPKAGGPYAYARDWFDFNLGAPYDLMGNVRFVLPFLADSDTGWFCSEAFGAALRWREPWRNGPNGAAALVHTLYGARRHGGGHHHHQPHQHLPATAGAILTGDAA